MVFQSRLHEWMYRCMLLLISVALMSLAAHWLDDAVTAHDLAGGNTVPTPHSSSMLSRGRLSPP